MDINRFLKQFNWRFLLVRIVVNALALAFTAAVLPKIYFVDRSIWNWLFMAFMLGVLNALLKPLLQFLTLQFIFVTYGLVIVLVNALLLWLLSRLFPARFAAESLLWLLVGGLILGLFSSFLESLLGLTMPIVPEEPPELRQQIETQARQASRLAASSFDMAPQGRTLAAEPAVSAYNLAETPTPKLNESPSPPVAAEADLPELAAKPPAETSISEESEPASEPQEEEKEEPS
ncbi:MAG: phage holin family protein [Anaerolineales bacterium]